MKGMRIPIQPGILPFSPISRRFPEFRQPGGFSVRPRSSIMRFTRLFAAAAAVGLAGVCSASDKWDAQDPGSWSHDTVHQLMHDSPWARPGKVTIEAGQGGMNRRGGQYPNDPNNPNGGNYPGGGGTQRGGIFMPGGIGLPFPGGGIGLPGGHGGGRRGGRQAPGTTTAVVRWDSALPLRLAYTQQDPDGQAPADAAKTAGWRKADEAPPTAAGAASAATIRPPEAPPSASETPREYIIAVDGFPLNSGNSQDSRQRQDAGSSRTGDRTDTDASNNGDRDNSQYGGRDPEVIREELMERTTISRGCGRSLRPVKVEFDLPGKTGIIYFHFSREDEITPKDKELVFQTQLGGNRLECKFETKAMVYKGKLEL